MYFMLGIFLLSAFIATIFTMIVFRKKDDSFDLFTIKRGRKRAKRNEWPPIFNFGFIPKNFEFSAIFADNCDKSLLTNILFGVSYGFDPNYRSIKIQWKYNDNLKVIQLYCLSINKMKQGFKRVHLINVALHQQIDFGFQRQGGEIIVTVFENERNLVYHKVEIEKELIRFKIFPAIQAAIDSDIKIFIK